MFRALPCSSSGGPRHNCIYAASGIVTLYRHSVTIPEAAYIQLRCGPPEDEQGNARKMQRILINVLYLNKQEFCASSWRSNQGYTKMLHGQPTINTKIYRMFKKQLSCKRHSKYLNIFCNQNEEIFNAKLGSSYIKHCD